MMSMSTTTWSAVVLASLQLLLTSGGELEIGDATITRAYQDTETNKSLIWNPRKPMGIGGLITGLRTFMVNVEDCIRIELWRPLSYIMEGTTDPPHNVGLATPAFPRSTQPIATYWLLVQQTSRCFRAETANQTFIYNLLPEEHIRFELQDVLGFSYHPGNPVPFDLNEKSCSKWQRTQSLIQEPAKLTSRNVYGFLPTPDCRVYSVKAAVTRKECVRLIPSTIALNLTFTSSGRYHDDNCWVIKPLRSRYSNTPVTIYLRYVVMTIPDCSIGHVEMREGSSSTSPLIRHDCHLPPKEDSEIRPIRTGSVYIRLWRRRHGNSVTITLQYSTNRIVTPACRNIAITEKPVLLSSPNYPNHYPPNINICWKIAVAGSSSNLVRVELSKGIDLQPPVGCKGTTGYRACDISNCRDFVEVTDQDGTFLTRWCDHTGQDLIETSSGQNLTVRFTSDTTIQGTGFQIKVFSVHPETAQCTHYLALLGSAQFQSPYYPYSYPTSRDDCWSVRASDVKSRLLLTVQDSQLEADALCAKDFVEVRDGASSAAPLIRRWCGTSMPSGLLATGGYIHIRFVSNDRINLRGFAISYTQVTSDECTTYYAYAHREYLQPDYGQTATGYDIRCWLLRAERGKLRLEWDSLGPSAKTTLCGNTFIELRDGDSRSSPLLGKFCQDSPIPTIGIQSTGSDIYVRWVSDMNTRPATFRLIYRSLSSIHCPLLTVGDSYQVQHLENYLPGMLTTRYPPYYGRGTLPPRNRPAGFEPCETCKYGPNQERCWTVEADPSYSTIQVTVKFLELQGKDDRGQCKYDVLEIHDGNAGDDPLLVSLCGTSSVKNFTTTGRWLFVRFQSDAKIELRGFLLEVRANKGKEHCLVLKSRHYNAQIASSVQNPFPIKTNKCWTIRSPSHGQPIKVVAHYIALDVDDVIEFYDGTSTEDILLRRFDNKTRDGATIMSSGGALTVVLRTGSKSTSRGRFDLQYSWVHEGLCSYVSVETEPTYIMTKQFGSKNYSSNDYLCWVMTVLDPAYTIEVTTESFSLEGGARCAFDYLEIYEGPKKDDNNFLHRWCGELPHKVLARSSFRSLYMVFSSNARLQFPGFKLKVTSKLPKVIAEAQSTSGKSDTGWSSYSLIIALSVIGGLLILILILALFLWNRKLRLAAIERAEAAAPVVVYTQPPAYRPPSILGAMGGEPEEVKMAPPLEEEAGPQRMAGPPSPTPPATPTTPGTTDTIALM